MCCFRASLHSLSGCMKHNHKTYPWILGLQSSFDFGLPAVHRHRAGMLLIMNLLILPAPPSHWWSVLLFSLTPLPYLVVWLAPAKNHPGCLKTSSKLRHLDSQQIQQSPSNLFENWNHLAHHLPTSSTIHPVVYPTINSNPGMRRDTVLLDLHQGSTQVFPHVFQLLSLCIPWDLSQTSNSEKLMFQKKHEIPWNPMKSLDVWWWFMSLYLGMSVSSSDRVKSFSLASSNFWSSCWCFSATYHQLTSKISKQATQRTLGLHLYWKQMAKAQREGENS